MTIKSYERAVRAVLTGKKLRKPALVLNLTSEQLTNLFTPAQINSINELAVRGADCAAPQSQI